MKIIVSLQVEPPRKSIDANELADFAEAAVRTLKLGQGKSARAKAGAGIGILITRSAEVKRLNRRFRGKNKPTDVLSFPAAAIDGRRDYPFVHIGDIAISADIASETARRLGQSATEEVKILTLHGVAHLTRH